MIEYEPIAYGVDYCPADDDEDWETIYPEGFREEQEAPEESVKPMEEMDVDGYVRDWQQLMDIAGAVNSATLEGEATGNAIVGVAAAVLENDRVYRYSLCFERMDAEPQAQQKPLT